jgi:hypothetical protein
MIRGAALGALIVIVLLAVLGCSSANVTEQRHEQVPGKAWFVDIDTRPPSLVAPVDADGVRCTFQKAGVWFRDEAQYRRFIAEVQREYVQAKADAHFAKALNLLQVLRYFDEPAIPLISAGSACHPYVRVLAIAAIGTPAPQPVPIEVRPDGTVILPSDFKGRLRMGDVAGQDASAATTETGVSAYARATEIVGSKIKAPPKGVWLILLGGVVFLASIGLGIGKIMTPRLAIGFAVAGAATVALGWAIDSAAFGWLVALVALALCFVAVVIVLDSKGKVDGDASIEAMAAAVNKTAPGLYEKLKAEVAAAAGKNADRVARRVKKAKKKNNITRKAETATIG